MKLELTIVQFMEIQNALPQNYSLCYEVEGIYLLNTDDAYGIKPVIELIIFDLYDQTLDEFFASLPRKYDISILREEGQRISDRFLERNTLDGITSLQSAWVLEKAGPISILLLVGALAKARELLLSMSPDEMTEDFHWITQERINLIIEDINLAYQNN